MADESGDDDIAPRDGGVRTERAVKAMMDVGLDRALVVKTLKKLYKVSYISNNHDSIWNYD